MASPIEMMIDRACGVPSDFAPVTGWLILHCPQCNRSTKAPRDKLDPPQATRLELKCPKCIGSDFETLAYFDKDGAEILPT